jgi:threonine/homoserine/homoserine lactone efflux protein
VPQLTTILAFGAAAGALILLPGPGMLLLLARGVGNGRRVAVFSALGVETGTAVYVGATAAGLTAVLASSALAFSVVRYLGAAYLIALGVRTLLGRADLELDERHDALSPGRAYLQAFLIGVSNPKIAIFFLAFFPQFIDPNTGPAAEQVMVLGAIFVAMALTFDLFVAAAAGAVGGWLRRRPSFLRRQKYVTGSVYLALGASAATTGGGHG